MNKYQIEIFTSKDGWHYRIHQNRKVSATSDCVFMTESHARRTAEHVVDQIIQQDRFFADNPPYKYDYPPKGGRQ